MIDNWKEIICPCVKFMEEILNVEVKLISKS